MGEGRQRVDVALERLVQQRALVDGEIAKMRQTGGTTDLARQAAILDALAGRETSEALSLSSERVATSLAETTAAVVATSQRLSAQLERLASEVHSFTEKADQGTNRLATWTMWLAIVTGLLVVAAVVQAWVMWRVAE